MGLSALGGRTGAGGGGGGGRTFGRHPVPPLPPHPNPRTRPPRSFPRALRLGKVHRGAMAGGRAVSDKRSILSSPARERAAGPVRGMCAVIGSRMREPSQAPVSTVTAVRCHPSVQLSPREGRGSFSLLTQCKCPLSG